MKISDETQQSPAIFPPILSSNSPPDWNPHVTTDPKLRRRRTGKPVFAGNRARRRRHGALWGRRSGPVTPHLHWKFNDGDLAVAADDRPETGWRGFRRVGTKAVVSVSARKLAASLWQLAAEVTAAGGGRGGGGVRSKCRPFDRLGFELGVGHTSITFPSHHDSRDYDVKTKDWFQSPPFDYGPKHGTLYKLQPSLPFPKFSMEGATKWDPWYSKTSTEVYHFYSHMNLLENQQVATVSVASALRAELVQARCCIKELETERRSIKKKVEHFLRKLGEERTSWMRREHQKIWANMDDLKDELNRERRNCQRMETVNSRLLKDLADVKLSAKQYMQDYEKERKARMILEDVCNELVKEIEEDKAEVEGLKRESTKIREEMEEERKMLQMAEVWREERVHMKLVDAKMILEEKYLQMNNLIADLEPFLKSKDVTLDMIEMSEAEVIRQAVNSVDIQDIKEFSYMPPESNDIYSIIEDLQNGEAKQREIDCGINYSRGHASELHAMTFEINGFNKNCVQKHSNGFIDHDKGLEDTSAWEIVTHAEDLGSSCTPDGSNHSVNRISRGRNISRNRTELEQNAGQESMNSNNSEICSVLAKSKKKAPSVCKLFRSSPSNGDDYKTIPVEGNGRLSNGSTSNMGTIPGRSGEGEHGRHDLVVQWTSPDSGNPHITRGMKGGCIEWPRGIQRYSLKAKLLEARVESQKSQMRNVLKQRS